MAMPATGALGIVSCPNGACSSIAGVVCGSLSGPISLCAMFQQAGYSIPQNMTNFHGTTIGDLAITPTLTTSIPAAGGSYATCLWSASPNTVNVSSSDGSWLVPFSSSVGPSPTYPGAATSLCVCTNAGAARSGTITYTPIHCGSAQVATFCQLAGASTTHCTYWTTQTQSCSSLCSCTCVRISNSPPMGGSDCYNITLAWCLYKTATSTAPANEYMCILCNGTPKMSCSISSKLSCSCSGTLSSFTFLPGDLVEAVLKAEVWCSSQFAAACVYITNVACINGKGCYCIGSPSTSCAEAGAIA